MPKDHIFCIPGNHDIDRERQKMCFVGARHFAQSQNQIDALLSLNEDVETLFKRQENYRHFQSSYLRNPPKDWTDDGLGYITSRHILKGGLGDLCQHHRHYIVFGKAFFRE